MRKTGAILVCIGIIILISPIVGEQYMSYKRNKLYQKYIDSNVNIKIGIVKDSDKKDGYKSIKKTYEKEQDNTRDSDRIEKNIQEQDELLDYSSVKMNDIIGRIVIPSIEVDLLIIEGESKANLAFGAVHIQNTAYPGKEGNCVIAGHRNYTFGRMFNRIGEVKKGEFIHVLLKNSELIYIIDDMEIIEPTNLEVLNQPKDVKCITLLTCHPINIGNKRLLIKGHLLEEESIGAGS